MNSVPTFFIEMTQVLEAINLQRLSWYIIQGVMFMAMAMAMTCGSLTLMPIVLSQRYFHEKVKSMRRGQRVFCSLGGLLG